MNVQKTIQDLKDVLQYIGDLEGLRIADAEQHSRLLAVNIQLMDEIEKLKKGL